MTVNSPERDLIHSHETLEDTEENRHWLHVALCIIDANKGSPDPRDINPLIPKVEQHLGSEIWKVLIASVRFYS